MCGRAREIELNFVYAVFLCSNVGLGHSHRYTLAPQDLRQRKVFLLFSNGWTHEKGYPMKPCGKQHRRCKADLVSQSPRVQGVQRILVWKYNSVETQPVCTREPDWLERQFVTYRLCQAVYTGSRAGLLMQRQYTSDSGDSFISQISNVDHQSWFADGRSTAQP